LTHTLDTRSRFGCAEERIWPCTIGMNKKGGMTDVEFEKYIDTSIVPLFPALEDTKGKRVLLKVDSGLGRNGRDLLMKCRFVAYMFTPACRMPPPCNRRQTATTVRSSSSFATTSGKYHRLSTLPIYRPLNTSTFGLIVYGGTIPVGTRSTITCRNALTETFDAASNKVRPFYFCYGAPPRHKPLSRVESKICMIPQT
jgi:hypothetical protein